MRPSGPGRLATALGWVFRDRRTGAITIAQAPNAPLLLFIGLKALDWAARALETPVARTAAGWLGLGATLALVWWALAETLSGVNPWRRFLGAAVLAGTAWLHWPMPTG